jgi:hypothetical protein
MNTRDREIALAKLEARTVRDGCWVWLGGKIRGYGQVHMPPIGHKPARSWSAHRLSWEVHRGPIPPWMLVCHRCDNPSCWNPDHLFLGTNADNVRDGRAKGRGPGYSKSVMNMQKAEMIRRMWGKDGIDKHEIASRLNLSWAQVHDVIAGRSWQLGP